MRVLEFALVTLLVATVLATIAAAITRNSRVSRICGVLGAVAAASGLIAVLSGLVQTYAATSEAAFSQADRQRMWSNWIAETIYNVFLFSIVALPALAVARWVTNKKAA